MRRRVLRWAAIGWLAFHLATTVGRPAWAAPVLELPCTVSFNITEPLPAGFLSVAYEVSYDPAELRFVGSGPAVSCRPLARDIDGTLTTARFDDDDGGKLETTIDATGMAPIPGFTALAICDVRALELPESGDFIPAATAALDPLGQPPANLPNVMVLEIDCALPVTTTTTSTTSTTSTSTTTSTLGDSSCADPIPPFGGSSATDCLFILRAGIGLETCDPACLCAPKGTLPPVATDALLCLRGATGQTVTLDCPCT